MPADTILYRAVVGSEFRAMLRENADPFGIFTDSLSAPVAQPDEESLDFWTEGVAAMEIYACASSCSFGPVTKVFRPPEVRDDQGRHLRERDRGIRENLLNHRTIYR